MVKTVHWEIYIALMLLVFGCFAYLDDRPTHEDVRTEVISQPFLDGGALVYRWKGFVVRNCRGHFRREIRQGSTVYRLNDRPFTWLPSERWNPKEPLDFIVSVPLSDLESTFGLGPASYHVTEVSACNQIQALFGGRVESEYPPVEFVIEKMTWPG